MNTYLVFFDEKEQPILITAKNKNKALNYYLEIVPIDPAFGTCGIFDFNKSCDDLVLTDIISELIPEDPNEVGIDNYEKLFDKFESVILEKVKNEYFKDYPYFAELYLNYYHSDDYFPDYKPFPPDMMEFIWRKTIKRENFTLFSCINLTKLNHYVMEESHE